MAYCRDRGIQSFLMCPMVSGETIVGNIGIDSAWPVRQSPMSPQVVMATVTAARPWAHWPKSSATISTGCWSAAAGRSAVSTVRPRFLGSNPPPSNHACKSWVSSGPRPEYPTLESVINLNGSIKPLLPCPTSRRVVYAIDISRERPRIGISMLHWRP